MGKVGETTYNFLESDRVYGVEILNSYKVTVDFVGFDRSPGDYSLRVLKQIALSEAGFVESPTPDIVVCSEDLVSIRKVLELYPTDTVRVLFNCELGSVDFNLFDYVIGWDDFSPNPRYARMHPALRLEGSAFRSSDPESFARRPMSSRGFCSFVASNGLAHPMRDAFVKRLSEAKRVDSWGKHMNNSGQISNSFTGLGYELEKIELESGYKFSLAIENGLYPGYITEKVFSGTLAGAVPIYWGNPLVGEDLNLERIFSLHEYESIDAAISAILQLEADPERLESMIRQPIMTVKQEQRVSKSRQEILNLFLDAAENVKRSHLYRPLGTTASTRELILVSALKREESVLRRNAALAQALKRLGLLRLALKVASAIRGVRKNWELSHQSDRS